MTDEEVCRKFSLSITSLKRNFNRTAKNFNEKYEGLTLVKIGRGKNVCYEVEIAVNEEDNKHAVAMLDEDADRQILFNEDMLSCETMEFIVFVGLCVTSSLVFRGTYKEFLKYIDVYCNQANIDKLKLALKSLDEKNFLGYYPDKTDIENTFTITLLKNIERKLVFDIHKLRVCKKLQEQYNKKSMVPLIKTWLAVEKLSGENQSYTYRDLEALTGMNCRALIECNKILKEANIYNSTKLFDPDLCISKGTQTVMNAFMPDL